MTTKNQLTGAACEFAVCWQLSARGWVACPTRQGAMGIDVLASKSKTTRRIQVKGNERGRKRQWLLSVKCENPDACDFYVFVTLTETPEFHIVPASVIAQQISTGHQQWLETPGRDGRAHADNPMRRWADPTGEWLNRWELLD